MIKCFLFLSSTFSINIFPQYYSIFTNFWYWFNMITLIKHHRYKIVHGWDSIIDHTSSGHFSSNQWPHYFSHYASPACLWGRNFRPCKPSALPTALSFLSLAKNDSLITIPHFVSTAPPGVNTDQWSEEALRRATVSQTCTSCKNS